MYASFYKLTEQPFELTPDPRFLHLSQSHWQALTTLVQGILLRKGIAVLTGPIGTGKTTLLFTMLQALSNPTIQPMPIATALLVNPTLTREEFLEAVLTEFEVQTTATSKVRQLAALQEMLLDRQGRGGTAVLVVDEAHLLSAELLEEIRLLSNMDTFDRKLLQVVLSGQPELLLKLDHPRLAALRQRVAMFHRLRPLTLPETSAYIAERLFAAGLRGPSPLASNAVELVFEYSRGVPRVINLLCDACFTQGFRTQSAQIGRTLVRDCAASLGLTEAAAFGPTKSPLGSPSIPTTGPSQHSSSQTTTNFALRRGSIG
jgi:general secretion pathway protein A